MILFKNFEFVLNDIIFLISFVNILVFFDIDWVINVVNIGIIKFIEYLLIDFNVVVIWLYCFEFGLNE